MVNSICMGLIELRWTRSKRKLHNENVLSIVGFEPQTFRLRSRLAVDLIWSFQKDKTLWSCIDLESTTRGSASLFATPSRLVVFIFNIKMSPDTVIICGSGVYSVLRQKILKIITLLETLHTSIFFYVRSMFIWWDFLGIAYQPCPSHPSKPL